jgi:catechol 2,3-dioxygenase-like lactoylglutathione lyase family enzyme
MSLGRSLLVLALLVFALPQRAAATAAVVQGLKIDGGFQELVISVPDLEEATQFYQHVAGWRVIQRGATPPELLAAWGLPDRVQAIEAVLQSPGSPTGFIRLIKFRGAPQQEVRPDGHPWESGGLMGFTVTTNDIQGKYTLFRQGGWHGYSAPVQVKRARGVTWDVLMQGFAGEVVDINQPADAGKNNRDLSSANLAFATVADIDSTLAFYADKLGFHVVAREDGLAADPGPNVLGMPQNLVNNLYRRTVFLHPQGDDALNPHMGSLAFSTYYGAQGTDYSSRAHAPNLGVIAVRFAVGDADGRLDAMKAKGVTPAYAPTDIGIQPYGVVSIFGVRDPNGILLEFFEPREKPAGG